MILPIGEFYSKDVCRPIAASDNSLDARSTRGSVRPVIVSGLCYDEIYSDWFFKMTHFQAAVLQVVGLVPAGKVVSYGQVAAYIGTPRAARQVGWAMSSMEDVPDFPWWRVINNAGQITINGNRFTDPTQQRQLLEAEGVVVDEFHLDMETYRFRPTAAQLETLKLDPLYVQTVLRKYDIG